MSTSFPLPFTVFEASSGMFAAPLELVPSQAHNLCNLEYQTLMGSAIIAAHCTHSLCPPVHDRGQWHSYQQGKRDWAIERIELTSHYTIQLTPNYDIVCADMRGYRIRKLKAFNVPWPERSSPKCSDASKRLSESACISWVWKISGALFSYWLYKCLMFDWSASKLLWRLDLSLLPELPGPSFMTGDWAGTGLNTTTDLHAEEGISCLWPHPIHAFSDRSCHLAIIQLWQWRICSLEEHRKSRRVLLHVYKLIVEHQVYLTMSSEVSHFQMQKIASYAICAMWRWVKQSLRLKATGAFSSATEFGLQKQVCTGDYDKDDNVFSCFWQL